MENVVWRDMDGTILNVGDTVVITEPCLYVPKLKRGVILSYDEFSLDVGTEDNNICCVQDERTILYLFTQGEIK